jgi:hypothetical protein
MTVFMWNRRTDYHHAVLTEHIRDAAGGWTNYQTLLSSLGISGTGAFKYVLWFAKPPFAARGADTAH